MATRLAVIIVHYKTPGMLADCLDSLRGELDAHDRVVVVDNDSGAEMAPRLQATCAELRKQGLNIALIAAGRNLGFAGANNLGIHSVLDGATDGGGVQYVVLLNPDTVVRPGAFNQLRSFSEEHPDVHLVGPRLEYPDGQSQLSAFGDHTPISELIRGANVGGLSQLLKRWQVYGAISDQSQRADWLAGACVMLRAAGVLPSVGPLDERFFMYFEEVDFFRRARQSGFAAWHVPAARVVHLVGQASGVTTNWQARRLPAYWFESRHWYFRKHFGTPGMLAADAGWLLGHGLMRLRQMLTGVSHSAMARHELRDFLVHAWRALLGRDGPLHRTAPKTGQAKPPVEPPEKGNVAWAR